jgi:hypothetical protein
MSPPMKVIMLHLPRPICIVPFDRAGCSGLFCTPQAAWIHPISNVTLVHIPDQPARRAYNHYAVFAFRVFITAES